VQPSPAPRFSRTQSKIQSAASLVGEHSEEILSDWGYSDTDIQELKDTQVI
jgi:alpha-methylacyl-CoA racemase